MEKYRHQQFSALAETIRQPAVNGHYGTGLATLGGHLCADGWWMRMKRQWTPDELADQLDQGLPKNPSVKILPNGRIVVTPLVALAEPVSSW